MNFTGTLMTIFEIVLVAAALWAVFHEDRFIAFEEKIISRFRRRRLKIVGENNICKSYYPLNR